MLWAGERAQWAKACAAPVDGMSQSLETDVLEGGNEFLQVVF